MKALSPARRTAATTHHDQIRTGTPEEAYQAVNRARMLWNFRRRDIDSWQEVITKWVTEPKAWHRIPEGQPYGTPKAMIETEINVDYNLFIAFVQLVIGGDYAAMLSADHPVQILPSDPAAAARYLAEQMDHEWLTTFQEALKQATAQPNEGTKDQ